jgi:hypothetical protein
MRVVNRDFSTDTGNFAQNPCPAILSAMEIYLQSVEHVNPYARHCALRFAQPLPLHDLWGTRLPASLKN